MDTETRAVLVRVLADLDAEHRPWTPGCRICWPKDELRRIVKREDGDG